VNASALLARIVERYHETFCTRREGQAYLAARGLTDPTLLKTFQIGYADGSLLKRLPRTGAVREQLRALGVITAEGRELLGGCVVVPIPDPQTGAWTTLYGRGVRTARHCYLPGPLRGVLNFQAVRSSDTVILTESILDALSFLRAGITSAIPIYGTNGFTSDHLDLLTRERVTRVILALDRDAAGQRATESLRERLTAAGLAVRVLTYPALGGRAILPKEDKRAAWAVTGTSPLWLPRSQAAGSSARRRHNFARRALRDVPTPFEYRTARLCAASR
jgi:DNA primase